MTKVVLALNSHYSVVEPDLCVICDPQQLNDKGCDGALGWIVEILSPGNSKKDMRLNFDWGSRLPWFLK